MAGELITKDGQWEIRSTLLGPGTPYEVFAVDGHRSQRARPSEVPRPHEHGVEAARDLLDGRQLVLEIVLTGASADKELDVDDFSAAWAPSDDDIPLVYQEAGTGKRRKLGRPRRYAASLDRAPQIVAEFLQTDPREYDNAQSQGSTGLGASGGGRTYDRTYNLTYGGAAVPNIITAVNDGNFETRPVATIDGPVDNPFLEHVGRGERLRFQISLGASDQLVIDFDARTVTLNGTASRYSALTNDSEWWSLDPGSNEVRFGGSSAGSPTLTLTWRSAWL